MKKILIFGIVVLLLITQVAAVLTVDIEIKPLFSIGETVEFDYTISSDKEQEIIYIRNVECPDAPIPLLISFIDIIKPNIPITKNYEYVQVTEDIEPQTCVAYIEVISPEKQRFEKTFTIQTLPSIVFRILTCKDLSCETESKIFIKNENIYLSYISDIQNIRTDAILTYPDKTTQQITLPTSVNANQIGTYELELTASKEGYKTITKKEQFGVIKSNAVISSKVISEGAGTESTEQSDKQVDLVSYLLKGLIISLVIVMLICFIKIYLDKRRRKQKPKPTNSSTHFQSPGPSQKRKILGIRSQSPGPSQKRKILGVRSQSPGPSQKRKILGALSRFLRPSQGKRISRSRTGFGRR